MLDLAAHEGHRLHVVRYGRNLELECLTCRATLQSQRVFVPNKDWQRPRLTGFGRA